MSKIRIGLFLAVSTTAVALLGQVKLGVGLMTDSSFDPTGNITFLTDSAFLLVPDNSGSFRRDLEAREFVFVSYRLLESEKIYLDVNFRYYKRYSKIYLGVLRNSFGSIEGISSAVNKTLMFPIKLGVSPFKRIELAAGLAPTFHINDPLPPWNLDGRPDVESGSRAIGNSHKSLTFNYEFSAEFLFGKRVSIMVFTMGSLGRINKRFNAFDESHDIPIRWKSFGASLNYVIVRP